MQRLDSLETLSTGICHETESQCTEFPVEAIDENGYFGSTEEEPCRRSSKAVFILHFANGEFKNRILQLAIS